MRKKQRDPRALVTFSRDKEDSEWKNEEEKMRRKRRRRRRRRHIGPLDLCDHFCR